MRHYLCYWCTGIAPTRGTLCGTIKLTRWSYPCITGSTGIVENIRTPWITAWLMWWSYSLYYRWHWKCREHWDSIEDCLTYMVVIFCVLQAAMWVYRALEQHWRLPDLYGGQIICVTDDTGNVESTGTAWRTAWLTWWAYSLYYRWHWECRERWDTIEDGQTYTMVIFCATFAVPLLSLAYTYTCVGRRLWLRASPGNADPTRDLAQLRAKRKVTLKLEISFCLG